MRSIIPYSEKAFFGFVVWLTNKGSYTSILGLTCSILSFFEPSSDESDVKNFNSIIMYLRYMSKSDFKAASSFAPFLCSKNTKIYNILTFNLLQ